MSKWARDPSPCPLTEPEILQAPAEAERPERGGRLAHPSTLSTFRNLTIQHHDYCIISTDNAQHNRNIDLAGEASSTAHAPRGTFEQNKNTRLTVRFFLHTIHRRVPSVLVCPLLFIMAYPPPPGIGGSNNLPPGPRPPSPASSPPPPHHRTRAHPPPRTPRRPATLPLLRWQRQRRHLRNMAPRTIPTRPRPAA